MGVIEKQIAKRRKEALEKDFYGVGQEIVQKLGKNEAYKKGDLLIKRDQWDQQWTGGGDDIEIFFKGNSVYLGKGNNYVGPSKDDIKRYVPGDWEETLFQIAETIEKPTSHGMIDKKRKEELLQDWGIQ